MTVAKTPLAKPGSTMPNRARIVASAMASMQIEGLDLDARSVSDFAALQAGALSSTELRKRLLKRYSKQASAS